MSGVLAHQPVTTRATLQRFDTFTWHTSGPLSLLGAHSVTLEYRRPWETTGPAAKTFKFTVEVVAP